VNYSKWAINRVLGLREVENCDVKARKEVYDAFRSRGEWDSLLEGLMREGTSWIGTVDRPQRINTVDLLPEYKAWASFIQTVIDQTSATAEMIREMVIILLSLISDEEIDLGELVAHSLHKLARTDRNTLGHCCLINRLCQAAQVPVEPTDVTVRSLTFISDSLIEGYEKELERHERNAAQQQQHQMMEQDQIPQVPPPQVQQPDLPSYYNKYSYSMANWAQDMSSRDRVPAPAFPQPFYEAAQLYRRSTNLMTGAYERFSSPQDMENYFDQER